MALITKDNIKSLIKKETVYIVKLEPHIQHSQVREKNTFKLIPTEVPQEK